ncbi:MAG: DUF4153 domain-containing protein [Sphingomonas sp.]
MTDAETVPTGDAGQTWRLRPAILAAIGLVAAVIAQQLTDPYRLADPYLPSGVLPEYIAAWRTALAIGIGAGTLAFGFGVERTRLSWAVAFALLVGAVTGLVYYWSGGGPGWWFGDWRYASLVLSIAITVPLFQTARDQGGWRFPYAQVHGHAWTNVVLWFAFWAFIGLAFLLAWLLSALFDLIGLHFIREMLQRHWFSAGLAGAAFGGSLGLFRERDRVVRLLQRVVTAVLAVLAPVFGTGLLLFLVALPFTGLGALWEATKSTTPILLSCVIGALILANAVIGNGEDEEATNPVLRWGAMALGLAALPLCVIAAIATGLRIDQYGFTPDRLWALVFVILATAYGVAYFGSLVLGRSGWTVRIRPANLRMAFVVSFIALFLATPILSFNAISTRDQVARLESGRIKPDKFDWAALAFDFGDSGKAALKRLTSSRVALVRAKAKDALSKTSRYDFDPLVMMSERSDPFTGSFIIRPAGAPLPDALRSALLSRDGGPFCFGAGPCRVLLQPDGKTAIAISDGCAAPNISKEEAATPGAKCVTDVKPFLLINGKWKQPNSGDFGPASATMASAREGTMTAAGERESLQAERSAIDRDDLSLRPVPFRQVYVGNKPVGPPYRDCSLDAEHGGC